MLVYGGDDVDRPYIVRVDRAELGDHLPLSCRLWFGGPMYQFLGGMVGLGVGWVIGNAALITVLGMPWAPIAALMGPGLLGGALGVWYLTARMTPDPIWAVRRVAAEGVPVSFTPMVYGDFDGRGIEVVGEGDAPDQYMPIASASDLLEVGKGRPMRELVRKRDKGPGEKLALGAAMLAAVVLIAAMGIIAIALKDTTPEASIDGATTTETEAGTGPP